VSGQPLNSLIANRPQRRTNREASHSRKQNKSSNFIFALFPTKCGTASSESNSGLLWLGRKEALVTVSGPDGKLPAPAIIVSCGVTAPGHPGAGIDSLAEFRRLSTIRNTPFGLRTGGRAVAISAFFAVSRQPVSAEVCPSPSMFLQQSRAVPHKPIRSI